VKYKICYVKQRVSHVWSPSAYSNLVEDFFGNKVDLTELETGKLPLAFSHYMKMALFEQVNIPVSGLLFLELLGNRRCLAMR